jgi:hypothetical protein
MEPASVDRRRAGVDVLPVGPRVIGRVFATVEDKDFALAVLRAYNDWHVDEWCAAYQISRTGTDLGALAKQASASSALLPRQRAAGTRGNDVRSRGVEAIACGPRT